MERNADILTGIKAPVSMTRWNESKPEFPPASTSLAAYADRDVMFEEALSTDAHALADRKIKRGEPVENINRLVEHSRNYIAGELAVFALQTRELPAAEVYPGSNLASAH
jgi:hypothetical protein